MNLEIKSVVYIVCGAIGLGTSDYSFTYVARWSEGDPDLLKETANRVVVCADAILQSIRPSCVLSP